MRVWEVWQRGWRNVGNTNIYTCWRCFPSHQTHLDLVFSPQHRSKGYKGPRHAQGDTAVFSHVHGQLAFCTRPAEKHTATCNVTCDVTILVVLVARPEPTLLDLWHNLTCDITWPVTLLYLWHYLTCGITWAVVLLEDLKLLILSSSKEKPDSPKNTTKQTAK